jgi:23S rRNA G2445 N2-methylase RlmL
MRVVVLRPAPVMSEKHDNLPQLPYFATAAKGTEGLLRDELRSLKVRPVRGDRGGVHFGGDIRDAFGVCLHSRIAMRVLEFRGAATVADSDQLYDFVSNLNFSDVLSPQLTLAVSANVQSSTLTHSQYVARRVKDAIVDRQRRLGNVRSDVDPKNPDVHFYVHLAKDCASIYVDLAGESLHRRGYRLANTEAPLKETLASALVQLSRWDTQSPLFDPCCGSGTIVLEAALMAANWAPGLGRKQFGLERHVRVDDTMRKAFEDMRQAARAAIVTERSEVVQGSDIDLTCLTMARDVAQKLKLCARFMRQDILNLNPWRESGTIVTNPPYGVRLEGGHDLATRIGQSLSRFKGHRILVLTTDRTWLSALGRPPAMEHTLFNGNLECRALGWDL